MTQIWKVHIFLPFDFFTRRATYYHINVDSTPTKIQGTTLSASSKSAMISLIFSTPTDTCIKRHAVTTTEY
jgi:hypothetical protein